ncbi:hypothetical protein LTR70_001443 [Exophiala xenobiotica]|uniref:Uncharacterized protein n=1 Tax=Lithohypha guttulata TaxID=1690604 RepID=A0ABR0KGS9_9EURO|nr:hypothetical protein LTR24_002733 [Lithohypha guttulata]KAK5327820.1 hypothetical protein LTR70_001443 [Exophiala xenobiotica]
MTAKVAQYITVIDRSNKVIGNSKQFKDVFREAKVAYQDRKAEIKAQRKAREEVELQKAIRAVSIQDESERASTIRPHASRRNTSHAGRRSPNGLDRPRAQHMHSNTSVRSSGTTTPREGAQRHMSLGDFNDQIYGPDGAATQYRRASQTTPTTPTHEWDNPDPASRGLVRARTDLPHDPARRPSQLVRAHSVDDIDMDLAYGEYHPESLAVLPQEQKEKELKSLVTKCKMLLDEADCAGHSAKAIIGNLQKNPDTLAAVGLTLAEISSLASKMAPGALGMIAKSAPAVMALLVSPQFLIAVGVSVGVTVIAIGGYKIVKRIKEKAGDDNDKDAGAGLDEAIDVHELDRIERWRRGIPEDSLVDDNATVVSGTSVEGEFITPYAAQSMGHLPAKSQAGKSKSGKKSIKDKVGDSKKKHRRHKSETEDTETVLSADSESTVKRSSTSKNKEKSLVRVKKPSTLSRMFNHGSSVRS